jgi:uncharacterized protein YodC (DUF2158 family)
MKEIKPGDVVQLKSGSPKMTVAAIYQSKEGVPSASCDWSAGGKAQKGTFPIQSLTHA